MSKLPQAVINSITEDKLYLIATSSKDLIPNVIYFKYVKCLDDERLLLGDNKMDKTLKNLLENPAISILFEDKEKRAYQIKGTAEYFTEGEYYEEIQNWCESRLARKGAVVVTVTEVYSGSEKIV